MRRRRRASDGDRKNRKRRRTQDRWEPEEGIDRERTNPGRKEIVKGLYVTFFLSHELSVLRQMIPSVLLLFRLRRVRTPLFLSTTVWESQSGEKVSREG
jgi:hypothetical protein